ncbi:MAG TPA: pyridoxine 5'-phosphate synthase [Candidatus Acidoferrum sp.]|nr:pyridoxine 5'-phosphate synthase [Candidatus Acidoferrum sp.]
MAINLSVNLNKVALLRNSRGGRNPAPTVAAETCIRAGAAGLTLHWRQDNRHTREGDVRDLVALARRRGVEFNLEGDGRDELVALALELEPTQFTLVPVKPGEVTSDHGWDLPRQGEEVSSLLAPLVRAGIRTAIFVDVDADMAAAAATGAHRIEIYTEPYARAFATPGQGGELGRLQACARAAAAAGLGVNAGHDLDLRNLPLLARAVPELLEVSIGHALISDALYIGLESAVRAYVAACRGQETEPPVTC